LNIHKYLKKLGHDTVTGSFYRYIRIWESYYRGSVKGFHNYRVYNGKTYTRQKRYSLGMAKKTCEDMADLLLNEHVGIVLEDDASQAFVDAVLKDNDFWIKGNEYQERKSYSGTVAYVPHLQGAIIDELGNVTGGSICINYVSAQDIYPITWNNGYVTECAFAFHHTIQGHEYDHIQLHLLKNTENGAEYVIENHIVQVNGNSDGGTEVDPSRWGELGELAHMAQTVRTGSSERQFVIDRLNIVNSVQEDNPMGMAVFANSLDQLRSIDVVYDSYVNEFVLGKKRIYTTPEMLSVDMLGNPVFDPNDVVFYMLPEEMKADNKPIIESNMTLRSSEHNAALNDMLNILSVKTGFGTKHYKFETGNVATATQVISENSDMFRTLKKHEIILEAVLIELIEIILRLGVVAGADVDTSTNITVAFDDSIIEDKTAERERDRQDVSIGAMRLEEYRAKWYNEDLDEAKTKIVTESIEPDLLEE
jgi:A118 family predicted phage portal protein